MKYAYTSFLLITSLVVIEPVAATTGSMPTTDTEAADVPQKTADSKADETSPDSGNSDDTADAVEPPEESATVCERVTCSNHGVCILLDEQPSCACDEGYVPDSINGLNCVSSEQQPAPAKATATSSVIVDDVDSSTLAVSALFPEFPTDRVYQRYLWLSKVGRFHGAFTDFVAYGFSKKKKRGAVLLGTAGGLTAISAVFFGFGIAEDRKIGDSGEECRKENINGELYNKCENTRNFLYLSGSIFAASAVTLYVIGGIVMGRASSRLRKLRQLQDQLSSDGASISLIDFTPLWEPEHDVRGVTARFWF